MTPAEKKASPTRKTVLIAQLLPHKRHSRPPYAGRRLGICFLRAFPPQQGKDAC